MNKKKKRKDLKTAIYWIRDSCKIRGKSKYMIATNKY